MNSLAEQLGSIDITETFAPTANDAAATKAQLVDLMMRSKWRVSTTDGRTFVGFCTCTDRSMNLIMENTREYLVPNNQSDDDRLLPMVRKAGAVMIPGRYIEKILVDDYI
jgi:small nuclear ribonucleoprotein (snRNP)-like protein